MNLKNYPAGAVIEVDNAQELERLIQEEAVLFVDFFATWCRPCHVMSEHYEALANKNLGYKFVKCNVDNLSFRSILQKWEVLSLPTFIALRNDANTAQSIKRVIGTRIAELRHMVEETLIEV